MRRRSRASSKPATERSRKAKTVRHSSSSASSQKTEIARLARELHEAQVAREGSAVNGREFALVADLDVTSRSVLD